MISDIINRFRRKPRQHGPDRNELLRCYPPELPVLRMTQEYMYDPINAELDNIYCNALFGGASKDELKQLAIALKAIEKQNAISRGQRKAILDKMYTEMLHPGYYDMDTGV